MLQYSSKRNILFFNIQANNIMDKLPSSRFFIWINFSYNETNGKRFFFSVNILWFPMKYFVSVWYHLYILYFLDIMNYLGLLGWYKILTNKIHGFKIFCFFLSVVGFKIIFDLWMADFSKCNNSLIYGWQIFLNAIILTKLHQLFQF